VKHLFWRAQISILRAFPPLSGVVSTVSMGAANSRRVWLKTFFLMLFRVPMALLSHLRNKCTNRVVLSRISVPVTTRCTLHCDKCAAHVPDLAQPHDVPAEQLIADAKALFFCVDHVYATIFSGGEAFLHPQLDEIIMTYASFNRSSSTSVQTNGTLLPNAKVIAALKATNATVKISNYPSQLQPNVEQLKSQLREHGIRFTHASGTFWCDVGQLGVAQSGCAKRRFSTCIQQLCLPYYKGNLHLCGESFILLEENQANIPPQDYINLHTSTPQTFAKQLRQLLRKRHIKACDYCLGYTCDALKIPIAEQRERS